MLYGALAVGLFLALLRFLRYRFVEAGEAVTAADRRRRRLLQRQLPGGFKPKTYPGVVSEERFIKNSRGVELFTKQWLPKDADSVRGLIVACHGWSDTCCYLFEDPAGRLASAGYAVFGMDYEGFGMSEGLHLDIRDFSILVGDVVERAKEIRARPQWAALPLFLYGDSMGGAVAIQAHRRCPSLFDGAVLLAPMCQIGEEVVPSPRMLAFLTFLAALLPRWRLVPKTNMDDVVFRDPRKRQFVKENPFRSQQRSRLGSALQLLRTTQEIGRHLHEVSLPLLVLHGSADRMTDARGSQALVERAASQDKRLQLYPESWHSLATTEPDEVAQAVLADVLQWLDERAPQRRA